jgi:hypothetical protein
MKRGGTRQIGTGIHSGTTYIDESVLEIVPVHKLLLYAHFLTYVSNSYTIVKKTSIGL